MTDNEELYVGCAGIPIQLHVNEKGQSANLSGCSILKMIFQIKGKDPFVRDAVFTTNGTDGLIEYVEAKEDFAYPGELKIEGFVSDGVGRFYTTKATTYVSSPLVQIP